MDELEAIYRLGLKPTYILFHYPKPSILSQNSNSILKNFLSG
ncbi:hypothetical protein [Paenibacillus sp.]|nr:hypothetical protein [Paenibacillus sp.]